MKMALVCAAIILNSGCRVHKTYGSFSGGKTWYGDKNTTVLYSPIMNRQSLRLGPTEFCLIGAPGEPEKLDPLDFGIGGVHRGGSGRIRVEVLTNPGRALIGEVITDVEDGKPSRTVARRRSADSNSWIVRVTEVNPIGQQTEFNLFYHFRVQ